MSTATEQLLAAIAGQHEPSVPDDIAGWRVAFRFWLTESAGRADSPVMPDALGSVATLAPQPADQPDKLLALLVARPGDVLTILTEHLTLAQPPDQDRVLLGFAIVVEALWADARDRDQHLVLSAIARLRFHTTHYAATTDDSWKPRFRTARTTWVNYLDNLDNDPWLASRTNANEADIVAICDTTTADADPLTARYYDSAITRRMIDNHLLPRGMLLRVADLASGPDKPNRNRTPYLLLFLPPATAVAVLALWLIPTSWTPPPPGSFLLALPPIAAVLGLATLIFIGLRTPEHNPLRTRLLLPRLTAGSVVGIATLLTLHPSWWQNTQPTALLHGTALGLLLAAAITYQAHELRNHGATGRALIKRTAGITALGLAHAMLISWLTLRFIAPTFVENGHALTTWWRISPRHAVTGDNPLAPPWWIITAATIWSYTVGVFIQMVWDDKPITAPLGRTPRT